MRHGLMKKTHNQSFALSSSFPDFRRSFMFDAGGLQLASARVKRSLVVPQTIELGETSS